MARSHQEPTPTHAVGNIAERQRLLRREVGDLTPLLAVARVAVQHHARDLVLDRVAQTLHRGRHHRGALRVAARDDHGVGALAGRQVEEALSFAVGTAGGAFGKGVGAYARGVGAADALAGDLVGAVLVFEALAGGRADGGTLLIRLVDERVEKG